MSVNQSMFESIGLGNELLIPPAVEPEPLFSPVTVAKDGTSAIQLISASYVVEERKPIHALVLNNQQTLELMKLVQGDRRVTYLHSPKVTVWDRETAEIASVTQRPFVVDVQNDQTDVRVSPEGTTLVARPSVLASGAIQLDLRFRADQIEEVAVYDKTPQKKVQSPHTKTVKIELSATLKPDETLVVWCADPNTPPASSGGLSILIRKKNADEKPKSQLALVVTPRVIANEVARTTDK